MNRKSAAVTTTGGAKPGPERRRAADGQPVVVEGGEVVGAGLGRLTVAFEKAGQAKTRIFAAAGLAAADGSTRRRVVGGHVGV